MKDGETSLPEDQLSSRKSAIFLAGVEGQEAGSAGVPASANPYEPGTLNRLQWLGGWMKNGTRARPPANTPADETLTATPAAPSNL